MNLPIDNAPQTPAIVVAQVPGFGQVASYKAVFAHVLVQHAAESLALMAEALYGPEAGGLDSFDTALLVAGAVSTRIGCAYMGWPTQPGSEPETVPEVLRTEDLGYWTPGNVVLAQMQRYL